MAPRLLRTALFAACLGILLPTGAMARHHTHKLKPYVVILDPGHGGPYTGAADSTGLYAVQLTEKALTLSTALYAAKDLRAMGYTVFLTRTRDGLVDWGQRDLNGDGRFTSADELVARNLFANRHHGDIFLSIHYDGTLSPGLHGTHGYYCPARPFWRKSRHLATLLTAAVPTALQRAGYPSPDNGIDTDVNDKIPQTLPDYPWFLQLGPYRKHFVIPTMMPGALIESLYLSSPRDVRALHRPGIVAAIGRGYANGIRAYFGGKVKH